MAKVKGPLHSDGASGTLAGTTTFFRSRGINVARQPVVPKNPRSDPQLEARIVLRVVAEATKRMNTGTIGKPVSALLTPKEYYESVVKPPDVWGNVHTSQGYPGGKTKFAEDVAAYMALTPEQQTAWSVWNDALQKPFEDVQPITEGGTGYASYIVAFSFCAALGRTGYLIDFDSHSADSIVKIIAVFRHFSVFCAIIRLTARRCRHRSKTQGVKRWKPKRRKAGKRRKGGCSRGWAFRRSARACSSR